MGRNPAEEATKKVWTKYKMNFQYESLEQMRKGLDIMNEYMQAMRSPITRSLASMEGEAPWMTLVVFHFLGMAIPVMCGFYLNPLLIPVDPRRDAEEERVRLCLQKGLDPYPYLSHRDNYYDCYYIGRITNDKQVPPDIEGDTLMMERKRQRRKEHRDRAAMEEAEAKEAEQALAGPGSDLAKGLSWSDRLWWGSNPKSERPAPAKKMATPEEIRAGGEEQTATEFTTKDQGFRYRSNVHPYSHQVVRPDNLDKY